MKENTPLSQYVKEKTTVRSIVGRIAVLIIMALLLAILSQIEELTNYMLIIALGIVMIGSACMRNFSSEYEYLLSDGEFFIGRIYGVSKHKELFSFSVSDVSEISENTVCENAETVRDFSSPLSEFPQTLIKLSDGSSVILSLCDELKSELSGGSSYVS